MCDNSNASKIDYNEIFKSEKNVMIGHYTVLDKNDIEYTAPRFEVSRPRGYDEGDWMVRHLEHWNGYGDGNDISFPESWSNLKGEELCRVINDDYELYKASGKDEYSLKQFKPVINDAVVRIHNYAIFKSKESAILAGKIAIFMDEYRRSKIEPYWID